MVGISFPRDKDGIVRNALMFLGRLSRASPGKISRGRKHCFVDLKASLFMRSSDGWVQSFGVAFEGFSIVVSLGGYLANLRPLETVRSLLLSHCSACYHSTVRKCNEK